MNELYAMIMEAAETTASNHKINIFSESGNDGMSLLKNEGALTEFAETLVANDDSLSAKEKEDFVTYAKNSAKQFVTEATMSQDIQPFAGFQIALLKEIYSRQIGRRLITTEVLSTPEETVGTFKTVLVDANGVEHDLTKIDTDTEIADGWHQNELAVPAQDHALFVAANLSAKELAVKTKILDMKSGVVSVEIEHFDSTAVSAGNKVVTIEIPFGEDGSFARTVKATHVDGTVTEDQIFGLIKFKEGKISLASANGTVKKATFKWRLSNSMAEINDYELMLKYSKEKVVLDDGKLFNVGIPLNYLTDVQAFFSIDGMTKAVEQIAAAINVLDDKEILTMVRDSVVGDASRTQTFDYALPATGISRAEHNKNLLEAINKSIAISDNNTQFKTIAEYNIACNPVDAAVITSPILLQDPRMSNVAITSATMNYTAIPMVAPAGAINILSSKLNKKGNLFIVPKGLTKEERVIGKFKYSSIVYKNNEYRSSANPNIRNIAARHREQTHVFEKNAITQVVITNN